MEDTKVIINSAPVSERYWSKGNQATILGSKIRLGGCWFDLDDRFVFTGIPAPVNLSERFPGLYGLMLQTMNDKFEKEYPLNLIELRPHADHATRIMTTGESSAVDWDKGIQINANELYKVVFPVPLDDIESFMVNLYTPEWCHMTTYENSMFSVLLKFSKSFICPKLEIWKHNNGTVMQTKTSIENKAH